MCGLAGIFDTWGRRPVDRDLLTRMNQLQFHRGPDEGGVHLEPGVGLAHRRLSIIDLSSGQQPMHSEDGSVVVVFNGEIYNFAELMKELDAAGYRFQTRCDTEVILYAWKHWGECCVERFRGMFAFALWDRAQRTLFMARDRIGIKPLYYAIAPDGRLLFASELKSILADATIERELDPHAVEEYFAFGYVPDPRSIFKGVFKLPPGHTLTVRHGTPPPAPRRYWDIRFASDIERSESAIAQELVDRLHEAVSSHLVADVPLGAFLSGGVDSSAVVAMMAELSAGPINTCSIAFGDRRFNEAEYAAMVAERYRTSHSVEEVDPDDCGLIDELATLYDEPFADSSALPTYRVCELARRRVTVALSGDGGDEDFAGYRRYRWHMREEAIRRILPDPLRRPLFGVMGRLYPKIDWAPKILRAKSTLESIGRDSVAGYFHSVSVTTDAQRARLFSGDFHRRLAGYNAIEVFRSHAANAPAHPLSRIQYLDYKTYLPGDILTKVDRASMAHALEVRVPILDHRFVEWVATLPPDLKLRGREGKYIFKRALEPYLPNEVLYRPKMGFAVPLTAWFRGPLRERVRESLIGGRLGQTGLFDTTFIERLVSEQQSGQREHSAVLWSLLMFESFHRRVLEGSSDRRPPSATQPRTERTA
jgi:asparagine synthase (glutamine-hydrolysing)